MSNASRNPKRAAGTDVDPAKKADSDTSGERPALPHSGYAGMMSLGSEAFSAPLPPQPSEHPRVSPRMRVGLYVFGGALGVSLAAIGVALVLTRSPKPETPSADVERGATVVDVTGRLPKTVEQQAPVPSVPEVVAPTAPAVVAHVDDSAAPSIAAPETSEVKDTSAVAAKSEPAEAAKPASTSHSSDRPARARRHEKDEMSAHLSREQVIGAMTRVQPAVAACFGSTRGSAMASITIIGRTGRVTTAQVSGQGGSIGSCIARAVRGATFPRFADDSLTVRYPFAR